MAEYEWNTKYEDLSETLQKVLDAKDKLLSEKGNSKKWEKSDTDVRLKMIDKVLKPLNLKGKLTEDELDYLTEINAHTLRRYLEA